MHRGAAGRGRLAILPSFVGGLFPAAVVLLCCGLPLLWLVTQVVANPLSLAQLRMDAFRWGLLSRTVGYNLVAGGLATLLALPAAAVLGRGRGWAAAALWFVLPVTLLLPSLTYAYGWAQLVRLASAPVGGLLASVTHDGSPVLAWLGVSLTVLDDGAAAYLAPAGRADVARCVWSLATWLWPIPAAVIGLALRRVDADLQQAALLDGALWRVTARQLAGPAAAGLACATILAVQEFAVYEPTGVSVVATEVRQVFETGSFSSPDNPITAPLGGGWTGEAGPVTENGMGGPVPLAPPDAPPGDVQRLAAAAAVATAVPLVGVVAVLAAVAAWGVRRVGAAGDVDAGAWPGSLDAGTALKVLAWVVAVVTVGVPIVALVLRHRRQFDLALIWGQSGDLVLNSVLLASLAGAVALGVALAGAVSRSRWLVVPALAAFLVGGQLLAIALIRLYNRRWLGLDRWVFDGPPIMVMAYLARFGWLVLLSAGATWSRPWRTLRDVAAVDGATPAQAARYVVLPLAWPLLTAAAVGVLALSLTEVPATVLISPMRPQPIVPMLMTWVHTLENDPMIEASLLLAAVVVAFACAGAALAWAGVRTLRRGSKIEDRRLRIAHRGIAPSILYLLSSILILTTAGCGSSTEPDEIWSSTGTAPGQVVYPRAIAYSKSDDTFFVVDRVARVQHLDRNGRHLGGWQMPEWQQGKPVGLSVGPDGNVYVPDTHYHRVMVYTPAGQLVRQWGKFGKGDGEFIFPTDVAFDDRGRVFVSEYGDNDRVQVFDGTGTKLFQFGRFGNGDGEFARPQSLVIDGGLVYVADACNHRICVFTTDGQFVRNMGGVGSELGQFRFPYGMDLDADGHLVVCEFGNNRVQQVDKATGRGLKAWGSAGREPGQLAYPWAVAVDRKDRVVAVDAGNNRLQVFEF